MKEKKEKNLIITFAIIIIILCVLCVYLGIDRNNNGDGKYLILIEGQSVEVESHNAKLLEKNDDYALYNDNGLKLYDFKTKEIRILKLDIELNDDVLFSFIENGFIYSNSKNNENGFYKIDEDFVMFKNEYETLSPVYGKNHKNMGINYLKARKDGKIYVIDIETEKTIIVESDSKWPCFDCYTREVRAEVGYYNGLVFVSYFVSEGTGGGYSEYGYNIYNSQGELITKLKDDEYYSFNDWSDLVIYKVKE